MEQLTSADFSWQVCPARERWKAALITAAVIAIAAWLVAELMEQPAWGVFAVVVLVVGCNRFFFPTAYELTTEGITARYPLKTVRYQWPELRRFVYDETGGFLSPRARRSFLDEYRGLSLLFGGTVRVAGSPTNQDPLTLTLSPQGRGGKIEDPLTLILSPQGRGDKTDPLTLALSPQGRGDNAERIIQEILDRLPKVAVVRESGKRPAVKEQVTCGG